MTESEEQYLADLDSYYKTLMENPQKAFAQHPKPEAYGMTKVRAQELLTPREPMNVKTADE